MPVIDRLIDQINQKTSPIVVGLDTRLSFVPEGILQGCLKDYGNTPEAAAEAIYLFNEAILESVVEFVPAVKFQMACYELYGAVGLDIFDRSVAKAKALGLIVIDDSKRNDIGSTAALYAEGHLGRAPLITGASDLKNQDFLTVNPYLGSDTITPFVETCIENDKGIFLLARTSNPSASEYQEAKIDGVPLYEKIARDIQKLSEKHLGKNGFSPFGAVVGATWPEEAERLRSTMPSSYFLVPGYGAQGGTAEQAAAAFNDEGYGAIISSSRGIIAAWQTEKYKAEFPDDSQFAQAAAKAASDMRDEMLRALSRVDKLPASW